MSKPAGVVVPHRLRWYQEALAFLVFCLIRIFSATWRLKFVGELPKVPAPVIFCIWHNRLAASMKVFERFGKQTWPAPGLAALISASKDGALLARVLSYFNVTAVRGSSSRRGRQALLELTSRIGEGFNVAITPDGPRGPKYRVQEGVIALAQVTGATIVPASMRISKKWVAHSWDGFQIPWPFALCEVHVAETMKVPRDVEDAARDGYRQELERRLASITFD